MVLKLGTSESRLQIPGNFINVMLEKDGDDQLERWCEKSSITRSQEGN